MGCLSNLRQMALGVSMYTQDYEGYPLYSYPTGSNERWHTILQPYVRSTRVLVCPSAPVGYDFRNLAYGYNHQYLARTVDRGGPGWATEAAIAVPASTVAIADAAGTGGWTPNPAPWAPSPATECDRLLNHGYTVDPPRLPAGSRWGTSCRVSSPRPNYPGPGHTRVADRHDLGANVAFCDGHAKWMRREQLEQDNSLWNGRGTPEP